MNRAEQISIFLPPALAHLVRAAVASGEYASSSDVIAAALRDWSDKRNPAMSGIASLNRAWQAAVGDGGADSDCNPDIRFSADEVLNRLERKYQAIADAGTIK